MTDSYPTPYLPVEVVDGHLVRICPECRERIGERTDDAGIVTNHFEEHYEAQHRLQKPERQHCYVLAQGHIKESKQVQDIVLDIVRRSLTEMDWQLVTRIEDLPEGAPVILAGQVISGAWHTDKQDPLERQIRWYRREGDQLVFVPTPEQLEQWERCLSVFERWDTKSRSARGSDDPKFSALWEASDAVRDAARELARAEFYSGRTTWMKTLMAEPESEVSMFDKAIRAINRDGRPRR